ncbi:MAG: guanylate kinase [Lachnospiraceae bacterium]
MGKLFYIMGKSASGKDTIYKHLTRHYEGKVKRIVGYTTRPVREGEENGREYFFSTEEEVEQFAREHKIIELREYQTVMGPWKYFTADDGQIDLDRSDYLYIGTLESYHSMVEYFGQERLIPIYIDLDDGERLERAVKRERQQSHPNYAEVCRRFLADQEDFSKEKLKQAGIKQVFYNDRIESVVDTIIAYIDTYRG